MFLYVFSKAEKELLEKLGYKFIKVDFRDGNVVFLFENKKDLKLNFKEHNVKVYTTNRLYF